MWSSIEQSVAILCGCLPTLRPLFRRLYGSTDHDHSHTQSSVQHTDDESPTHVGIEIKRDFHQTTTMT
jgi:hypothetical protein